MSLRDLAERYARKRGLWRDAGDGLVGVWTIVGGADGLELWGPAKRDGGAERDGGGEWATGGRGRPIDPGTALILSHALATGLRLHVGRCPACVERGGGWELHEYNMSTADHPEELAEEGRRQGFTVQTSEPWRDFDKVWCVTVRWLRPCPECSEPGPEVECNACGGEGTLDGWPDDADEFRWTVVNTTIGRDGTADVPCGRCRRSGKVTGEPQPTGQRWLYPVDWVLACVAAHCCIIDDSMGAEEVARREAEFNARCADQTSIRAAASVLADRMQADGDPWGTWLAAWLAGDCQRCEGSGQEHDEKRHGWRPGPRQRESQRQRRCSTCHGDGVVLGAVAEEVLGGH
jgi:hypothetical protein